MEIAVHANKDKFIALGVSLAIHVLVTILFFYLTVWQAPNPPLDQYGIEVNIGVDVMGEGQIQTLVEANEATNQHDSKKASLASQQTQPEVEEQKMADPLQPKLVSTTEFDNIIPLKKEKLKQKAEAGNEVKTEEKPKALYTGNKFSVITGNGKTGLNNKITGNNNGDDKGVLGDKGERDGTLGSRNLYGKAGGGGGGPHLNMPGWRYAVRPKEDPYLNEAGKIVFQIAIDADGEIEAVRVLESTVAPEVVKWYRNEIYKTPFSRTITKKTSTDRGAVGTITFIIRSN